MMLLSHFALLMLFYFIELPKLAFFFLLYCFCLQCLLHIYCWRCRTCSVFSVWGRGNKSGSFFSFAFSMFSLFTISLQQLLSLMLLFNTIKCSIGHFWDVLIRQYWQALRALTLCVLWAHRKQLKWHSTRLSSIIDFYRFSSFNLTFVLLAFVLQHCLLVNLLFLHLSQCPCVFHF